MKLFVPLIAFLSACIIIIVAADILVPRFQPSAQTVDQQINHIQLPHQPPTLTPTISVQSPPPSTAARADYLIDNNTNQVLASANSTTPLPMASTTKIMTAVVAIEEGHPDQMISVQQDAYDRVHNDGGSSADLQVGDELPLSDMLYGLLLPSGDDAAVAIADTIGGSQDNFVQQMNDFAQKLHLSHTHYDDADGLNSADDTNHYTSAQDLTTLAQYAMNLPAFAQIVATSHYVLPATNQHHSYNWTNTNTLLRSYTGMLGIKTGYTYAAGYCLVFAAKRNGRELLGVVLNTPNDTARDNSAVQLLNWGFSLP